MRLNSTLFGNRINVFLLFTMLIVAQLSCLGQVTWPLGSPLTYVYGLTGDGQIMEINATTGTTYRTIKDANYSGNAASGANALGYNLVNGKFYYFKRNVEATPQEFVSFSPLTNTVTVLATSTCAARTVVGCVSYNGLGYYAVDSKGNLNYYDIATDTWTVITTKLVDQYGTNISSLVDGSMGNGDMTIDGYGNLWYIISSNSKYGLYKFSGPLPTTAVSQLTGTQIIAPTASTPSSNPIAGIAFNANGQIFMSSMSTSGSGTSSKLYLLQNSNTLTFVGNFSTGAAGADLTSQNFPIGSILPVTWKDFTANKKNTNEVALNWSVTEFQNKGFYIQHSIDGKEWSNLSFIQSRNIPETEQYYTFSYIETGTGKQYYRIKQVDIDGKESFSVVRVLNFSNDNSTLAIWPNPARNIINIDNEGPKTNIAAKTQIYSLSGTLNMEKKLQQGLNTIDISTLPAGAYIVKSNNNRGDCFTQKIIKQ
ncbi:MAG: T9SS type A sorting domain-containing protein [Bacteroidetes bacterium]|nr:T9SS type A sorting domain-containing protein [Bacteroidota bacterium]